MEETTYLQHYRVSTDDQGTPEQVSRSGAAINYKAADIRSGEPVLLQLIPLAAIDPARREQFEQRAQAVLKLDHVNIARVRNSGVERDRFVFVSEYLQGETADSWVIAHGPLSPDAVLRVALQVVRAIAAAAFYGLTHRAIQPANIMIVPGPAPEGGWPFVKLLNFGVAGVELHAANDEARELAPALPPQFSSPEQLRGGEIDFRSEIYSLGATMCFLLAGAVPLAIGGKHVRARLSSLPELRRAPRRLRKLLSQLLHERPEMRPQDPVALEKEIQKALGIAQPREQVIRSLTPVAPVLPEQPMRGPAPLAQVWRGVLAFAALLLLGGIATAFFLPNAMPWRHRQANIGKPVGVPERSMQPSVPAANVAPVVANQAPPAAPAPAMQSNAPAETQPAPTSGRETSLSTGDRDQTTIASTAKVPPAEQNLTPVAEPAAQTSSASPPPVSEMPAVAATSATTASREKLDSAPPSEGPENETTSTQPAGTSETKSVTTADSDKPTATTIRRSERTRKKSRVVHSTRKSPKRATIDPVLAAEEDAAIRRAGQVRAQFVGATGDGRLLLRLPSGEVVSVRPRPDDEPRY